MFQYTESIKCRPQWLQYFSEIDFSANHKTIDNIILFIVIDAYVWIHISISVNTCNNCLRIFIIFSTLIISTHL